MIHVTDETAASPAAAKLAVNDLSDAVATAAHIFEAANALFERVSGNVIALEKVYPQLRAHLGPISGLAWSMSELQDAIDQLPGKISALKSGDK